VNTRISPTANRRKEQSPHKKSSNMPKCRACVECQIAKRGCVTTSPGDSCDRCSSAIPPLKCCCKHSNQGTRNDLFSGSRLAASQLVSFEKPAPDSTCEPTQKMSSHPKTWIGGNEPEFQSTLATHHGTSLHNFISSGSSDGNIFRSVGASATSTK